MSCVKGSQKTGGRKKGTPNKMNAELSERMDDFISSNFDKFVDMMNGIVEPEKYCHFFLKALEFKMPKRAAVNVETESKYVDLRSEIMEMANSESDSI